MYTMIYTLLKYKCVEECYQSTENKFNEYRKLVAVYRESQAIGGLG
jgi:hypothetical protein